jgi:hypothetical protein
MVKFVLGLLVGLVVGVLAMASNPDLLEETRAGLAHVSGLVLRGTEQAAEKVGEVAGEVAEEAREAAGEGIVDAPSADAEPAAEAVGPESAPARTD